jgi:hypothetical protein
MTITEEQQKQMLEAAKPLVAWMRDNCHPHCDVVVDSSGSAELTECVSRSSVVLHRSDCAVHNAPAFPAGPCDCGAA